ncbi:MAG: M48 family metallopeptidase [Gammaproteobacteria bacterium]|jgi:STE24 endopeptidase|nr:M48 family metallopeptidase [Gammaproteobacteria bacterium]MBT4462170.1 M48 family metallopeptidase [Gammaproteobacteria bacterium]MBT4655029.1 M48 family metallopeptidase [Gammaproteobacteria bacterium]MBT5761141.1 M48 family metallopeptidase [Gammaproteobacteria bacterium]MBT6331451.1 M48 family metallopeptidase [Gammaproteobacteria bacterium]
MFFTLIMFLIIIYSAIKILLDIHQIKYIGSVTISNEELNSINLNKEYVEKSKLYNTDKLFLSIANTLIKSLIIILFLVFNGITVIEDISGMINIFGMNNDAMNIFVFIIIMTLIDLPISYYKTFNIEMNYGFNRQSKILFFKDFILSLVISMIIFLTLFITFHSVYNTYTEKWWLYMWVVFIIFNIFILYLFPVVISPLFNSFKKIDNERITACINDLVKKTNFNISDVYVMDGSKRSSHSNAYFTGFYKNKRIVFYDTLVKLLTPNEIKSVLAHEIGHYMKKHILQSMVISFALSLLFFYISYQIISFEFLFNQLSMTTSSTSHIVILFSLVLPSILYFIAPFFSVLSRKNEYEADDYAKLHSNKNDLITSLLKLNKENLNLVKSSPIYSAIYNSHPTVFERINNLQLEK